MPNRQRNEKGRFTAAAPIDVRNESQAAELESMLNSGHTTFVFFYMDTCGYCHQYKPMWKDLEKTSGRNAQVASIHYDMQEHVPTIANAKIQGYPSVIKVSPKGEIAEYTVPGSDEKTNAMPNMRDMKSMQQELRQPPPPANNGKPGVQAGINEDIASLQSGGSAGILSAFTSAIQRAGPAALLLLANSMMPRRTRTRTFKSPKRASRRANTRRSRRS